MPKMVSSSKLKFSVFQDERFVDLNLYQFGWERCEPLHAFGPHIRNHFCFTMSSPARASFAPTTHSMKSKAAQAFSSPQMR